VEGKSTIYNLFYNNLLQSSVIFFKNSNFPKKKISKSPDFQKHPRASLVFSKSPIGEQSGPMENILLKGEHSTPMVPTSHQL
jgi:hypothetical protein